MLLFRFLNFHFRRPVPPVEQEREQAEFETDIKFLRERERRMYHLVRRNWGVSSHVYVLINRQILSADETRNVG